MEPVAPTGAGAALSSISPGKGEGEAGAGDPGMHQGTFLPPGRFFFALWPAPATVTGLRNFARTWLARQGPEAATVWRLMQPETLHLTLAFLVQVTEERTPLLARVMGAVDFPALTFALDRWGWWPHNRILWAGCTQPPPALLALGNGLQVALVDAGFPLEARSFLPHEPVVIPPILVVSADAEAHPEAGLAIDRQAVTGALAQQVPGLGLEFLKKGPGGEGLHHVLIRVRQINTQTFPFRQLGEHGGSV